MNEYEITFISGGYTHLYGVNVLDALNQLKDTRIDDVESIKLVK